MTNRRYFNIPSSLLFQVQKTKRTKFFSMIRIRGEIGI
jgi:hypothetical protein